MGGWVGEWVSGKYKVVVWWIEASTSRWLLPVCVCVCVSERRPGGWLLPVCECGLDVRLLPVCV